MNPENENENTAEINLNHPCFDEYNEVELIIPNNWEFKEIDGKMFGVRKYFKYPKTYKECCDVLGICTMANDAQGYKAIDIIRFQELLIARDAYWKIYGEEMGLGKPWKPNWEDRNITKYVIIRVNNKIGLFVAHEYNYIFAFPTKEMCKFFYENFKDDIEKSEEYL